MHSTQSHIHTHTHKHNSIGRGTDEQENKDSERPRKCPKMPDGGAVLKHTHNSTIDAFLTFSDDTHLFKDTILSLSPNV